MTKDTEKNQPNAWAFHAQDGAEHLVGFGAIRVLVLNDDGGWFAQGLEVDFAASGNTLEETKRNFEKDFCATLHENLRIHGSIEPVLKSAPLDFWNKYLELSQSLMYWQVSKHLLKAKDMPAGFPSEGFQLVFHAPGEKKVA